MQMSYHSFLLFIGLMPLVMGNFLVSSESMTYESVCKLCQLINFPLLPVHAARDCAKFQLA
jgi:hypothetical protein